VNTGRLDRCVICHEVITPDDEGIVIRDFAVCVYDLGSKEIVIKTAINHALKQGYDVQRFRDMVEREYDFEMGQSS
jgi:3-methyladenine DNA glycosylase AlkD